MAALPAETFRQTPLKGRTFDKALRNHA